MIDINKYLKESREDYSEAKEIASDALEKLRSVFPGFIEKFEDENTHKLTSEEMLKLERFLIKFCNKRDIISDMRDASIEYDDVLDAMLNYLESGGNQDNW